MNLKKLIQDNWKGALVGVAVMAAAAYGGPIAGKAVGFVLPKALEHVSDTPVSDVVAHKNPLAPPSVVPPKHARTTLAQVATDYGIKGRLDCRVVSK